MTSKSAARGRTIDVETGVRAAITGGPPKEVGYGEENLGRYVHTVECVLARPGPDGGRLLDVGIYPGHLAVALQAALGAEVSGVWRFVPSTFRAWLAARGISVEDVDVERQFLRSPTRPSTACSPRASSNTVTIPGCFSESVSGSFGQEELCSSRRPTSRISRTPRTQATEETSGRAATRGGVLDHARPEELRSLHRSYLRVPGCVEAPA